MKKFVVLGAVVVVAVAGVLVGTRLLSGPGTDPTEPATAGALAAAAQRHLPDTAKLIRAVDRSDDPARRLYVSLDYEIGGKQVTLGLEATSEMAWAGDQCKAGKAGGEPCEIRTAGDTKVAVIHLDSDPGTTGVSTQRSGHSVWVSLLPSAGLDDLAVDYDVLAAIATDPLVGLKTSEEMLDEGKDVTLTREN